MKRWLGSAAEVGFAVVLIGVPFAAALMVNSGGRAEGVFNGVLLAEVLVFVLVVCACSAVREFLACRRAGASVVTSAARGTPRSGNHA
jgi:hypothetical protein